MKPANTRWKAAPIGSEPEYRSATRRELLKLLPLAAAGVIFVRPWRDKLFEAGLSVTDTINAGLFRQQHLAPTFADSQVAPLNQFPFNSFNGDDPGVDLAAWRLKVDGLVKQSGEYTLRDVASLPKVTQNTKHICVEGWDVIGNFGGTRLSDFLKMIGGDTTARYLYFECADEYFESLDMATAMHPQSLLCYEMYGKPLERGHGAPLRLRLPTKIGYKSAKYLTRLSVTNVLPRRGYWEEQGYDWFYGL